MAADVTGAGERRQVCRRDGLPMRPTGRIRSGRDAAIVNLSACGALVETSQRLAPGTKIELRLEARGRSALVRSRVVHCGVSVLEPTAARYRAGLEFDCPQPWLTPDIAG